MVVHQNRPDRVSGHRPMSVTQVEFPGAEKAEEEAAHTHTHNNMNPVGVMNHVATTG